jgi:hypothetical protein
MLILDVVRVCEVGAGATGAGGGGASASTPASLKVVVLSGDTAGDSANLAEDLLDQVLKCAGGGREPVGRVGRLLRKSCR